MEAQEAAEKKKKLEKKKSPVSEDSTSILKKDGVEPRETDLKKKAQVKKSAVAEKASVILTNVDVEEQVAESKNQIQGVKSAVVEDLPVANLGSALINRIPGVSVNYSSGKPGSTTDINIRNSITFPGTASGVTGTLAKGSITDSEPTDSSTA